MNIQEEENERKKMLQTLLELMGHLRPMDPKNTVLPRGYWQLAIILIC